MKSFWRNEWDLFLNDLDNVVDFFMQPVYIFGKEPQMLKPTNEEIAEKCDSNSFWKNEWNLFLNDLDTAADFLTQPVNFTK